MLLSLIFYCILGLEKAVVMCTVFVIKKVVQLTQCGHVLMPANSQQMAAAVLRRIALPSDRCRQFTSCIDPPTPQPKPLHCAPPDYYDTQQSCCGSTVLPV